MKKFYLNIVALAFSSLFAFTSFAQKGKKEIVPLSFQGDSLVYTEDAKGNRIPDYSYAGYMSSNEAIPFVPVKVVVEPVSGDATALIQRAIDYVSKLPVSTDGFRGAILLKSGVYHLQGRLHINQSGVVLRGEGSSEGGTQLLATGTSRETLIRIEGKEIKLADKQIQIADNYTPVGTMQLHLENASSIKEGDRIAVLHPCTQKWIDELGMSAFGGETSWWGWKPEDQFIRWDRTVTKVEGNKVKLDAPITSALDSNLSKSFVQIYVQDNRINKVGIENLAIVSTYNKSNLKDEDHCWNGISFDNIENAWVRRVQFKHLAGSAVAIFQNSSKVSVEDCISTEPVSEIGGLRRQTFYTEGQQTLFLRIYAQGGVHDFATGSFVAGPSAFVQCSSVGSYDFSGTVNSWASGILFDIVDVDRQALALKNRYINGYGAGWTAANCMVWQSTAAMMECFAPPTATNWIYGAWAQFTGNAYWEFCNEHINPRSLFFEQLAERIGTNAIPQNPVIVYPGEPTSSPTPEQAKALMDYAMNPAITLPEFIAQKIAENPISLEVGKAKNINKIKLEEPKVAVTKAAPLMVNEQGWLVRGDKVLTGTQQLVPWWSGGLRPRDISRAKPAITRFVPGKQGIGYTDKLDEVISGMKQNNQIAMEQHYALWYDRRRDDHERTNRINGEVWAPFLELPFQRSGEGVAWDGLSKYDLTKYNIWYWQRLKDFADKVDEEGLVLIHQNYFQHNILEAGAHWVDSPWRPTNNINDTQFPEPVPFAGDKRVFMDRHFYDETNEVRRPIHQAFINQCFDNFAQNNGVIQMLSAEYTGPLHFMQFWLDNVATWEEKTGNKELVALSATKDVQDSILNDTNRNELVDIIDIRYWASRVDGSFWAPMSDMHMAPRQHMRVNKVGKTTFQTVYSDVLAYRLAYPNKAVINSFDQSEEKAWAVFMAGGSLAGIPRIDSEDFLQVASKCRPIPSTEEGVYMLQSNNEDYIVYLDANKQCTIDLKGAKYTIEVIDATNGNKIKQNISVKSINDYILKAKSDGKVIYLLCKR